MRKGIAVGASPIGSGRFGGALGPVFPGLLDRGVVAGKHDFYRNWVRKFIGFVKPRKWDQAVREDVEQYLRGLQAEGKAGWQVAQANESLELFYREVGLTVRFALRRIGCRKKPGVVLHRKFRLCGGGGCCAR